MAQNWRSVGSFVGRLCRQGMRRPERSAVVEGLQELSPSFRGSRSMEQLQKPRFYSTGSVRRVPVVVIEEEQVGRAGSPPRKLWIVLGAAGGGATYIYLNNRQTVPFTHRKHFVLIGPELERQLGEQEFNNLKLHMAAEILPPIHPLSIRVRRVAREVIEAAMAGTKTQNWDHMEHHTPPYLGDGRSPAARRGTKREDNLYAAPEDIYGDEKLEDDMWVDKCRKKGLDEGAEGFTAHLSNLKWEVIVVDQDIVNAFCLPGGKIVVFTGLLKQFPVDTDVATVLGHEVGHVVARHVAEKLTQGIWLGFVRLFVLAFVFMPALVYSTSDLLLTLPFSRRMESEADHIGLMLMAAAGYDPRRAPRMYEKMGKLAKVPEFLEYVNTHPSGKRRAEALRNSDTMQEALQIYIDKISGQAQYGFL